MHNFNEGISTARFPDILKGAEVKPIFKKKSTIDKENYRAVSIFSVISKIFGRLIFKQLIMIFLNQSFLNISADFRKVTVHKIGRLCFTFTWFYGTP